MHVVYKILVPLGSFFTFCLDNFCFVQRNLDPKMLLASYGMKVNHFHVVSDLFQLIFHHAG